MESSVHPIGTFSVGAVLGRSFRILMRNFTAFSLMAIVITLPSLLLLLAAQPSASAPAGTEPALGWDIAAGVVDLITNALVVGALTFGTFQDLRGRRADFAAVIARGLSVVPTVMGVSIMTGLITVLGAIALVIPGIIAAVMLWVAVPAAVVERPGVIASLKRSAELTRGHRWPCLGAIVLVFVIQLGVAMLLSGAYAAIFGLSTGFGTAAIPFDAGYMIFEHVILAIIVAFGAVAAAVAYHDLRAVKEGIGVNDIAAVFD